MNKNLNFKDQRPTGLKVINDEEGVVGAFVAVVGNKDSVGDIIQPGAFDKHLKTRMPKGVWSHDWDRPVSKTTHIEEIKSGDPRLPEHLQTQGLGALYVETQFNLKTDDGRNAYENVKFFGEESEWSIGYKTHSEKFDTKSQANLLKEIELFEYSPVLFGANTQTSTAFIKAEITDDGDVEVKVQGVDEEKLDAIQAAVKAIIDGESDEKEVDEDEVVEKSGDVEEVEDSDDETVEEEESDDESDEEDSDEKSDEVATEVAGGGEKKGSPRSNRVSVESEKASDTDDLEVKRALKGSYEERYGMLENALRDKYSTQGWAYVYATFDDHLVYHLYDRSSDEQGYYTAEYSIDDEGVVTLGEPTAVDIVEVLVLKSALAEAVKFDMLEEAEKVIVEVLNEKAGRVLSKTNENLLKTAIDNIQKVIGDDVEDEKSEEADDLESRSEESEVVDDVKTELDEKTDELNEETEDGDSDEKTEESDDNVSEAEWMRSLAEFQEILTSEV